MGQVSRGGRSNTSPEVERSGGRRWVAAVVSVAANPVFDLDGAWTDSPMRAATTDECAGRRLAEDVFKVGAGFECDATGGQDLDRSVFESGLTVKPVPGGASLIAIPTFGIGVVGRSHVRESASQRVFMSDSPVVQDLVAILQP